MRYDKRTIIYLLLVAAAAAVVYMNSLPNEFVWDDVWLVVDNPDIAEPSLASLKNFFTRDLGYFFEKSNFYRPLQALSYMVDRMLWGLNAGAFRSVNILLHTLNSLLVFLLLLRYFRNRTVCLFSALFFAVHPVNTSAVAYVAGRADLLALFFLLGATWAFVRSMDTGRNIWRAAAGVFFLAALLTKEICVFWPLVVYVGARDLSPPGDRKVKGSALRFAAGTALMSAVYILLRLTVLRFASFSVQAENVPSLFRRVLALGPAVLTYLRLLVLPYDLRMDRDFNIPPGLHDPRVLLSILILAALVLVLKRPAGKSRLFRFGGAWFLVFLVPSLNVLLPLNSPLSEHWLYIPMPGICFILALGLTAAIRKLPAGKSAGYVILGVLVGAYGLVTVEMNRVWRSEETLFSYITRFREINPRANYNLGRIHLQRGRIEEALDELEKAVRLREDYYEAWLALSVAYLRNGEPVRSRKSFERAVQLEPDRVRGYLLYAQALREKGKGEQAIKVYKDALRLAPSDPRAYNGLGVTYAATGERRKALEIWKEGLENSPGSPEIISNLNAMKKRLAVDTAIEKGKRYVQNKDFRAAAAQYRKALEMDPDNLNALNNLGAAYGMLGRSDEAIRLFRKVIELRPDSPQAYKNTGIMLFRTPGKRKESVFYFRRYLELAPGDPDGEKIKGLIRKIEAMTGNGPR
jgi:Flp pilus assembly protein TadD